MSLPEGGIRQKMTQDELPAERQDAIFRGELGFPSLSKAAEPSPELLEKLEKYTKMKKMNVPEGAIRLKMLSEHVSAQEIALFFGDAAAKGTVATALKKPNDEVSFSFQFFISESSVPFRFLSEVSVRCTSPPTHPRFLISCCLNLVEFSFCTTHIASVHMLHQPLLLLLRLLSFPTNSTLRCVERSSWRNLKARCKLFIG
jgi:hypothetical protein